MTKRAPPDIPLEELRKRFHLPLAEVAKEFGVCMTFIKKVCRSHGIKRWPYRKIKSLQNKATKLSQLRACHAAKAVEKHVDTIRELTGRAGGLPGDDEDDDLGEEDDGLFDDEEAGASGAAMGAQRSRTAFTQGSRMNPALLRAEHHPYAYGQEAPGGAGMPRVSHQSHNALRDALLGSGPAATQVKEETRAGFERGDTLDTEDLLTQSDLAFEELWADGVWDAGAPSPVSMMMGQQRRMPRVGSAGRLRDLDDYPGMPSGGMPRNPSFERLHGMASMQRDRSYDRLDRMARERYGEHRLGHVPSESRPLGMGEGRRTLSSEHLERLGHKGPVKREEEEPDEDGPVKIPRNISSGSLREYMEGRSRHHAMPGMPRVGSHNSLGDLGGPTHVPRSGSQGNLQGMMPRSGSQSNLQGMPRNGSNANLANLLLDRDDSSEGLLLGDTMFVF